MACWKLWEGCKLGGVWGGVGKGYMGPAVPVHGTGGGGGRGGFMECWCDRVWEWMVDDNSRFLRQSHLVVSIFALVRGSVAWAARGTSEGGVHVGALMWALLHTLPGVCSHMSSFQAHQTALLLSAWLLVKAVIVITCR